MPFLNTILDIIFPIKCLSCGLNGTDLCISCLQAAPWAERESEQWVFPLFDYRHPPIKKALWLLKYKGRKRLAKIFAEIIYEKIKEEISELIVLQNFTKPILVPIPLSPQRLRERGFNQAELLCLEILKINNTHNPNNDQEIKLFFTKDVLIKTKNTEHQARIKDRRTRLKNMTDSFEIKEDNKNINLIKGRNIILIDDITTTGATLNEAKKMLKKIGARKIIAFTVAH